MCFNRQFSIFLYSILHFFSRLIFKTSTQVAIFISHTPWKFFHPYYIPSSYMIRKSPTHFIKTPTLSSCPYFCFSSRSIYKKAIYAFKLYIVLIYSEYTQTFKCEMKKKCLHKVNSFLSIGIGNGTKEIVCGTLITQS